MDPVLLARSQFAITTVYHFFFVPLTLGLSVLVALMETIYVRTGQDVYKQMTKFWGKLFVINFAIGVVTGIVQEFQFGMNWSEYSRFVGDVFRVPLAIEALLAFFLESTFLGIWIFGWDKLSKGLHALVIWLVAVGSIISAFWILVANSFMQQPVGYTIVNGQAQMTDFSALLLNPNLGVQFGHTVMAGFTTASFFVMGISAYHLIRKTNIDFFRRSFQIAAIAGVISIFMVILNGHSQTQHVIEMQPMKMASMEALWNTEEPASFSILTIGDLSQRRDVFSIRLPHVLCLLAYNQWNCRIEGIYDLQALYEQQFGPGSYIPPVAVIYWTFRIMVGVGFLLAALALWALYIVISKKVVEQRRSLKLFLWAIPLPYLANTTGWLLTEVGRIPWVVYGLMKIDDGISPLVSSGAMLTSLLGFTLIYGVLMAAGIYLLAKFARTAPPEIDQTPAESPELVPSLVGSQD